MNTVKTCSNISNNFLVYLNCTDVRHNSYYVVFANTAFHYSWWSRREIQLDTPITVSYTVRGSSKYSNACY